jgi:hypothetical protein
MEELVVAVLKLLVQLILYALTGKWYRLGDSNDQSAPAETPVKPRQRARARSAKPLELPDLRDPRAAREALKKALEAQRGGGPSDAQEPWFAFPDEYVEPEPQEEARGGEVAPRPTFQRHQRTQAQLAALPARGRPRSIASALRDRQTLRYAVALGAALGPRGTRR